MNQSLFLLGIRDDFFERLGLRAQPGAMRDRIRFFAGVVLKILPSVFRPQFKRFQRRHGEKFMRAAHQKNMRIIVRGFRLPVVRVFDIFILGKERRPLANIGFPTDMRPVRRRGRLARVLRQIIFEKTVSDFKRLIR